MNALTLLVNAANAESQSSAATVAASAVDDDTKNGKNQTGSTASDGKQKAPADASASSGDLVLPGAGNTFAAALAARENAMYQQIHQQQGVAAKARYLEEMRKEEEKLSKDRLSTIMLQHEREQHQAAAHRAAIMQLVGRNPSVSTIAPVRATSPQETEYLQQLRLEALVQQHRQETLANLAMSKETESSNGSGTITGAPIAKSLPKDVAKHKYQRQDTALQKAILMAKADEELLKQQLEKAQEQREIEHKLEHHRQEQQKAAMLQLMSNGDSNSVLAKALRAASAPAGPYPGSGVNDDSAILQLLEERERQRLLAQHFPKDPRSFMPQPVASSAAISSMPSSQIGLQQRLQHHLQSQQQNHGTHGERADLIGSVFAKAAAAAASKNQINHHPSVLSHQSPVTSQVLSAIVAAEEQEKQKLLQLQKHRQNSQESFQSSGIMMDARSRQHQQHQRLHQQALAHQQQQAATLAQQQQESIRLKREIQQGQDSVERDVAFRDSKSTILPCRARGMPMDHNVKTAYFVIPQNIKHGTELLCSYFACRNAGIKFRYCVFCKLPVAKRNFAKRHRHSGKIPENDVSKDTASDDAADTSVDDEPSSMCTLASPQQTQSLQKVQHEQPALDGDTTTDKKSFQTLEFATTPKTSFQTNECEMDHSEKIASATSGNGIECEEAPVQEAEPSKSLQCSDAMTKNQQSTAANHILAANNPPLVCLSRTSGVPTSKRQKAWEELLLQRPKTKRPNSDAMLAWIRDVLRVSDFEKDMDSEGSFISVGEVQTNGNHPIDGVMSGILNEMRPSSSKKAKTKALLSRKEQEDMEERKCYEESIDGNSNNESDVVQHVEEEISENTGRKRDAFPDDVSTSSEESVDLRVRKKPRS